MPVINYNNMPIDRFTDIWLVTTVLTILWFYSKWEKHYMHSISKTAFFSWFRILKNRTVHYFHDGILRVGRDRRGHVAQPLLLPTAEGLQRDHSASLFHAPSPSPAGCGSYLAMRVSAQSSLSAVTLHWGWSWWSLCLSESGCLWTWKGRIKQHTWNIPLCWLHGGPQNRVQSPNEREPERGGTSQKVGFCIMAHSGGSLWEMRFLSQSLSSFQMP